MNGLVLSGRHRRHDGGPLIMATAVLGSLRSDDAGLSAHPGLAEHGPDGGRYSGAVLAAPLTTRRRNAMSEIWGVVLAVHIVCAVLWVGGMFFALAVLRPSLGVLEPVQRLALHQQVFRRFFLVVWHAMPLSLLSGYTMLFGEYGGFAHAAWNVNLMQLLGLVMAGVFVIIVAGPYARFRAGEAGAMENIRRLIVLNLTLGLVTVAVAAM
jgi:uncharacterized membrane protein